MKSKKIIAASLGAALSLSMLCMPVYATSSTVSSIVQTHKLEMDKEKYLHLKLR